MPLRDFEERVRLERKIISMINGCFVSGEPLNGLSALAIASWCQGALGRARLQACLSRLSRAIKREAEHSQIVFEPGMEDEQSDEQLFQELDLLLASGDQE